MGGCEREGVRGGCDGRVHVRRMRVWGDGVRRRV